MLGAIGQSSLPDRFFFWLSGAFRETVCRTFGGRRAVNITYPARKANLNQIDKTNRLLYFLSASKRLPTITARPGNARGQRKEPY